MSTWEERLNRELEDLGEKCGLLESFITTSFEFEKLDYIDQQDLLEQLRYMNNYREVLHRRVQRLKLKGK